MNRRGFVAAFVAALSGLRLARGREIVVGNGEPIEVGPESWQTVRLNGRPVRLLRSRKVPPKYVLSASDGRVLASSGMSNDEIARALAKSRAYSARFLLR